MTCREIDRKFDQIVAFSGLEEFLDTPVKRYSTGMYARLGFAVAAHVDPEILIVDEVLSVGDFSFQNKCIERIKDIVQGGASVVFVSHDLNTVAAMCTRALLLDHGCVVTEGSPEQVIQAYLGQGRRRQNEPLGKEVFIERLVVRNRHGPRVGLEAGEDVWIDVDIKANQALRTIVAHRLSAHRPGSGSLRCLDRAIGNTGVFASRPAKKNELLCN